MTPLEISLLIFFLITIFGFTAFALISRKEKHVRAARLSTLFALLTLLLLTLILFAPDTIQKILAVVLSAGCFTLVVYLLWPVGRDIPTSPPPQVQVDERTTIFARARLQPGTPEFATYYSNQPDHKALDDAYRQNPGLLNRGAAFYNPLLSASPEGSFFLTEALRHAVDGPVAPRQVERTLEQMTRLVKDLAAYHGAVDAGICRLQPYHIYSHIGRGSGTYGAPVTLKHLFAIAITVEMSHEMINSAPRMPAVIESARQYVEASKIAVILAAAIRSLGYPARAHIDGNYRVIAPLIAKDAGLGEIGRMGILMTPRSGPRVRLSVVTTDLPLLTDEPTWDPTMIDFCEHCQKCALVCPSQSIPYGSRVTHTDGTLRWKINAETCYNYWTKIGTDCGRCMAVCPYAHADNLFHNLIRFGTAHSGNFRRAAIRLDDLFFGKNPLPHSPPDWVQNTQK